MPAPKRASSTGPGRSLRAASSARRGAARDLPEGEWIALVDGRIVAHAPTVREIDTLAREMKIESRVIISRVLPRGPLVY
jgi:hypothetical protein